MTTVAELKRQAEAAQRAYEEGKAKLFRPDGSKLYSDEAHEEELGKLRAERNGVLREVKRQAKEAGAAARQETERAGNLDPTGFLTADELSRANSLRAFALDAGETLGIDALRGRLEAVLADGDRGSVFAYWMAGERRKQKIIEGRREELRRAGRPTSAAATGTALDEVLRQMDEALGGKEREARLKGARARIDEAHEVETFAHTRRRDATSASQLYSRRTYGDVPERVGSRRVQRS